MILGAGITGLSCAAGTEAPVYEAAPIPGGICGSYYARGYRFELGGGHWIFGAQGEVYDLLNKYSPLKPYSRKAAVYFPAWKTFVPYPIQNHLSFLPRPIRDKALAEILKQENPAGEITTLADWLTAYFGETLCEVFFFPFHELYTAGLYTQIAPQDQFKSPVNRELIIQGAQADKGTPGVGYNTSFYYPEAGLDHLIRNMAAQCRIQYNKEAVAIDIKRKQVNFKDGSQQGYDTLVSTLPLDKTLAMSGQKQFGEPDPHTSVLVFNIGAVKGSRCPDQHWLYIPKSKAGFHRVGFYSNVDASFLPSSRSVIASEAKQSKVSIYVEQAFLPNHKPSEQQIEQLSREVVAELKEWQFIEEAEVVSPTWIDYGYTWQMPGSDWKTKAVAYLQKQGIHQTGRYGKWKFQGIAESVADGLASRQA